MEFIGFHGTTVKDANIILKEGFKCSDETSWLGKGVYFFEELKNAFDGYADAEKWCSNVKGLKSYAILRAIIKADNVFDLVKDEHDRTRYRKIYEELYKIHLSKGYPAEAFNLYTVFNIIGESVDVIRCIVDGKKYNAIPRNYVTIIPQIQICVCNNTSTVICDIKKGERGSMTDEAYERILSKIIHLSDSDYQRILSEAHDMERDYQLMIAGFTNDILGCETQLSAAYSTATEQVFSKVYMVENSEQSSENGIFIQTGRPISEHMNEYEDFECLAA